MKPLEMWGGLECTLNRVGDKFVNQCETSGHNQRLSDLKLFTELGIKKLRYPCLWELVAPKDLDHCDWTYLDERLNELKNLKQDFIAGFLHHGSGPFYTSLIDPDFPEKFATYARLFITRYPWVNDFTPINEINTTARFSLLYGHWYPHLKNNSLYLKSVVLQCKGTVLAMREIRRVNPKARLIQTDDIGKCQSSKVLDYQCRFENERRWLAWDLLCGKVTSSHPLFTHLLENGISVKELKWFEENTCAPDVIGLNHYLLSNRYLDHRLDQFPDWSHGGNERHAYADVGAVDTGFVENVEPEEIFREAWNRYQIPLAVTECHTRGRREAQMRWLHQIWQTAKRLRTEGVQFEAVTAWSLIGTFDWHNLCTISENFYEPGIFDLRNTQKTPQHTAMSRMVRELAVTGEFHSPLLGSEGTWKTSRRILWNAQPGQFTSLEHPKAARPILVVGSETQLSHLISGMCGSRNIFFKVISSELNRHQLEAEIEVLNPWAVVHTGTKNSIILSRLCRFQNIRFLDFINDEEPESLSINPETLVIKNQILKTLAVKSGMIAPKETLTPTFVEDLANECLDLLIDGEKGIVSLTNAGETSWEQFALLEKINSHQDYVMEQEIL